MHKHRGVVTINLTEFGSLVKALRNGCFDDHGNRLTREALSKEIHLTPNQLGRLERGDRKYLDTQTLRLLARALKLTNLERREFFLAAIGQRDKYLFDQEEPENQLNDLVELMENLQVPAFTVDPYGDLVAVNTSCMNLFLVTPEIIEYGHTFPLAFNHMYFMYSPEFGYKDLIGPGYQKTLEIEILLFRRSSLRYRHTEYFDCVFKNLLKIKEFDVDWYASQRNPRHHDLTYELFEYDHPRYGRMSYIATETIVNTQKGDLYLIIYNATNNETSFIFNKLKDSHKNHTIKLASWPNKEIK